MAHPVYHEFQRHNWSQIFLSNDVYIVEVYGKISLIHCDIILILDEYQENIHKLRTEAFIWILLLW